MVLISLLKERNPLLDAVLTIFSLYIAPFFWLHSIIKNLEIVENRFLPPNTYIRKTSFAQHCIIAGIIFICTAPIGGMVFMIPILLYMQHATIKRFESLIRVLECNPHLKGMKISSPFRSYESLIIFVFTIVFWPCAWQYQISDMYSRIVWVYNNT